MGKIMRIKSIILGTCGLALSGGAAFAQDLTISLWGGGYVEAFRKAVVEPFEKANGVSVTLDSGIASERLAKLLATGGRGTDLVYFTDYQMAELAKRGLLQPVDAGALENAASIKDFAKDPLGGGLCPAFTVAGVGLAYNSKMIEAPTSWADLFRDDLPGKKGFPEVSISDGPLMIAKVAEMEGGSLDDTDAGFAKIAAAKDKLQIYSGREVLDSINQGDVSLSSHLNIFIRKDDSVPLRFVFPKEGGIAVLNMVCVMKDAKNKELAQKFIDFHLSKEVQEAMLSAQGESTVRSDVAPPEDSKFNVISPEDMEKLRFFDVNKIVENRAGWIEEWQEKVIAE